jgi:hypothetical protein
MMMRSPEHTIPQFVVECMIAPGRYWLSVHRDECQNCGALKAKESAK